MKIAFFKGTDPGFAGIYERGIRWWIRSPYSHTEMVFSDGMCGTASWSEGGVVLRPLIFLEGDWDFIELPDHYEAFARQWFETYKGAKYDLLGDLRFVLGPIANDNKRWFCSEAHGAALGIEEPWRLTPADLHIVTKLIATHHAQNLYPTFNMNQLGSLS